MFSCTYAFINVKILNALKLTQRFISLYLNLHFYFHQIFLCDAESDSFPSAATSPTWEHSQGKVLNAGVFSSSLLLTGWLKVLV